MTDPCINFPDQICDCTRKPGAMWCQHIKDTEVAQVTENDEKQTTKVAHLDDFRPHWAIEVVCEHCGHTWMAVFPEGTRWFECGWCSEFTRWQGA